MKTRSVALLKYVKTSKGWRRLRASIAKNGRIRPHYVVENGADQYHPEGHYELKLYEFGKALYKPVGNDPVEAIAARERQVLQLAAKAVGVAFETPTDSEMLSGARHAFLEKLRLKDRDKETIVAYEQITADFLSISEKTYVSEIADLDLLKYCQVQRNRGLAERTVYNRFTHLRAFLRTCGVDVKTLLPDKKDRPQKNDPLPEAYTQEEVQRFLAACNSERDRLAFEFFLKTGLREKELTHSEWSDIRWAQNIIIIQNKPHYGFRTKTGKSRNVTLESALLQKLAHWQKSRPKTKFIFGTDSDKPSGHFWEACKRTARRAGLNCGHCRPCIERDECERWFLHKFRATFATWSLQRGVDIRTVQLMLGHTKIEMTERYLAPAEGPAAQARMNAVFAGLAVG